MKTEDRKLPSKTVGRVYTEDPGLLGCDTALLGHWFLTFRKNVVLSSSSMKQSKRTLRDAHSIFLQNISNH